MTSLTKHIKQLRKYRPIIHNEWCAPAIPTSQSPSYYRHCRNYIYIIFIYMFYLYYSKYVSRYNIVIILNKNDKILFFTIYKN